MSDDYKLEAGYMHPGEPKEMPFDVRVYQGGEVLLATHKAPADCPVADKKELPAGTKVYCPNLFGCWTACEVEHIDGKPAAMSGGMMYHLEWDIDDRHCWTCPGAINLAAMQIQVEPWWKRLLNIFRKKDKSHVVLPA